MGGGGGGGGGGSFNDGTTQTARDLPFNTGSRFAPIGSSVLVLWGAAVKSVAHWQVLASPLADDLSAF